MMNAAMREQAVWIQADRARRLALHAGTFTDPT